VQKCLLYVPRETIEDILFGPSVLEQAGYDPSKDSLGAGPIDLVADTE
jgi:hypothetical protein